MKYGVEYRSMHTGIHGIFICTEEEKAETILDTLNLLYQGKTTSEDVEPLINTLVYAQIEEIDYKDIEERMELDYEINRDGRVSTEESVVTLINANQAVDVYEI